MHENGSDEWFVVIVILMVAIYLDCLLFVHELFFRGEMNKIIVALREMVLLNRVSILGCRPAIVV